MQKPVILAIETSCDETSAAVVAGGRVLSNIIASQIKTHAKFGGVVPEVAAREHIAAIIPTINLALAEAKTSLNQIDCLAVTEGPGLATSLMVGIDTAKALGLALNKKVLPVNHLEAHIYANFLITQKFPAIILIVSGGHTMLVHMKAHGRFRIIGETLDDAAGEAFDKTAKMLGLGYPGGPQLSKLAEKGNPAKFQFPRPMIAADNFEFSFSGLKTAVLYTIQKLKSTTPRVKADLAASVQQAIVDVLVAKLEKAVIRYKPRTIMLGGGVAANQLLRREFQILASQYKIRASIPEFQYCTDNAAMIGLAAHFRLKHKRAKFPKTFSAKPNLPLH